MREPRVLNMKRDGYPADAVLVDRSTPYGNPFYIGQHGTREQVCDLFDTYAAERDEREPAWLAPLRGRDLLCHCEPQRCHARTLLRLANR